MSAQFPAVIDNTMLKDFRRCPQYFFFRRARGLRPSDVASESIDLRFGSAFATGTESARRAFFGKQLAASDAVSEGVVAAVESFGTQSVPARSNKTLSNLVAAIHHYFDAWPLGDDGLVPVNYADNAGIESTFKVELPFVHPETKLPLFFVGRRDMVAKNEMGGVVIVDEKTTGSFSDAWLSQWDMDPQMTGYIWMTTHEFGLPRDELPHALIRGIEIGKHGVSHTLVPIFRTDYQIACWYKQMLADVMRMLVLWQSQNWDRAYGSACVAYGRACEFQTLCSSPNAEQFVQQSYKVEFWNPLERK